MTVRRLFVAQLPPEGGALTLPEASAHHLRVLRIREGDSLILFDGRGGVASAEVRALGPRSVVCEVEPPAQHEPARTRVVLMLAVPKGAKLDECVRMATELGVDEVALMRTERTVPRWDQARASSRVERLTRIASEAAAQCERSEVPWVHPPRSCREWLDSLPAAATGVVFGARAQGQLGILDGSAEQVWCAIGPEGGFTDAEMADFLAKGFSVVSLGPWVLRVDTAVAAGLTLVHDRMCRGPGSVDIGGASTPP
jgi:16S rRNA (uracil1498-N3)-methyltransferase